MSLWHPLHVELKSRAIKDLKALDRPTRARILDSVERYAQTGHGDVKRLQGIEEEFRLRVGNWRVRFIIEGSSVRVLYVLRVLPRGGAYRG